MKTLEYGPKLGTPWHTIKPRARRLHIDTWMVRGADVCVFGPTLDSALALWRQCMLESQVG